MSATPVRRLPPGWQMYMFFGLYPVLWALGLAYFVWPVMAVVFCASLSLRRPVRVPPGFGLWGLFILLMLASVIELAASSQLMFFGWRALIYVTATALMLWVYNASEEELPSDAIAGALTVLWAVSVLGGLAGTLYPELSFHSVAQSILPHSILSNPTAYAYVHPALAEMQFKALGHPIGRPMTFYAYTNQWAAAVGVLTPFAIITAMRARRRFTRHLTIGLLAVAAIPVVVSINRGLWIALGIALVFVTVKMTAAGRSRVLLAVLGLCTVVGAVIVLSPLGGIIHERLTSEKNSNGTRSTLYQEAFSGVSQSPLFGFGSPRASEQVISNAHVGTQGQFYLVLFSHGIPATIFYLGWFLFTSLHALRRKRADTILWNCVILMSFAEMMVYDFLPVTMYVVMIACGLLWRERRLEPVPAHRAEQPINLVAACGA
jgi:O-antigen ligase